MTTRRGWAYTSTLTLASATVDDWRHAAECRHVDPELFFPHPRPENAPQIRAAKAVCAVCPSRDACLAWALEVRDDWAVLGGTTPEERRALRREPRKAGT